MQAERTGKAPKRHSTGASMVDDAVSRQASAPRTTCGTTRWNLIPRLSPRKSLAWLNLLEESEAAFEKWNDHCDKIDQLLASLERLANVARNREFQMFWANCEVLKPAIYAKAPVPVVAPKFKDRQTDLSGGERNARSAATSWPSISPNINDVMKQIRDDVGAARPRRGMGALRERQKRQGYYATEQDLHRLQAPARLSAFDLALLVRGDVGGGAQAI